MTVNFKQTLRESARTVALRTPLAPFRRFRAASRPVERADMKRIGSDYGGWAVPDSLVSESWIVYSAGIGDDASFDMGFIERYGSTIYAFDPTPSSIEYVEALAVDPKRFRFYPWGLWSEDKDVRLYAPDYGDSNFSGINLHGTTTWFLAPCRSLQSLCHQFGHDHIDLLKLDIEGAEYGVLQSVIEGDVTPKVLCVEFHKPGWRIRRMVETVTKLRRHGYCAVWVDGYDVTFVFGG